MVYAAPSHLHNNNPTLSDPIHKGAFAFNGKSRVSACTPQKDHNKNGHYIALLAHMP